MCVREREMRIALKISPVTPVLCLCARVCGGGDTGFARVGGCACVCVCVCVCV